MTRRALITGAAGFVGVHLAQRLLADGWHLDLVDNLSRGRRDGELEAIASARGARFHEADLSVPGALDRFVDSYDAVYHLAAIVGVRNVLARPADVLAINARTLLNVLDWFRNREGGKFFFSSTSETYAWTMKFHELPVPTPEAVPLAVDDVNNARATYALSKVFGEMAVIHACGSMNRGYAIGRLHNVYGPRMGRDHVIPELFLRLRRGERPLRVVCVTDRRAFCFVDDAIEGIIRVMDSSVPSGVYNIGNDEEEVSVEQLARLLVAAAGEPDAAIEPAEESGERIARRCPDMSLLRRATGYSPSISLAEGLRRTLKWYESDAAGRVR